MENKSTIVVKIILSIVTFGIYGIIWFYNINEEANKRYPSEYNMPFVKGLILSIVTCGIYNWIWQMKLGKAYTPMFGKDQSMIFLVLAIFGLTIVNMVLIQIELDNGK